MFPLSNCINEKEVGLACIPFLLNKKLPLNCKLVLKVDNEKLFLEILLKFFKEYLLLFAFSPTVAEIDKDANVKGTTIVKMVAIANFFI